MLKTRLLFLLALAAALVLGAGSAAATALDPVEAVVTFHGEGAPSAADVAVLEAAGITTGFTFKALPIAGVLATTAQLDALEASPQVASVTRTAARLRQRDLDESHRRRRRARRREADEAERQPAGRRPRRHRAGQRQRRRRRPPRPRFGPHLVQNVEAATNLHAVSALAPVTYVENVENTDATGGHGTHVAGIVGATGARSNGKYEGVAPGAKLVGYGSGAGLAILDVIGGFDYAIANKDRYGIDVITNSWGDTDDSCTAVDPTHPVTRATYETFKAGIVVVFSAGNSGPDPCTITGNYKKAPWVISVAAGDKDRALTDFSSRGRAGWAARSRSTGRPGRGRTGRR